MKINPYTFLIIPFNITKGREENFFQASTKAMHDENFSEKNPSQETRTWIPGRILKKGSKILYRESNIYPHIRPLFEAFLCNETNGDMFPNGDFHVFSLNKYDRSDMFDRPLYFKDEEENSIFNDKIKFAIFNNKDSIDSVKMIINRNTYIGLIIIPVSARLSFEDYQKFVCLIRKITFPGLKTKEDTKPWSLMDKISEWMHDFEGQYSLISDEAIHLTCLVHEGSEITDELRQQTQRMVGHGNIISSTNNKDSFVEVNRQLYICSSAEGTTILTVKENITDGDSFKKYYSIEQTERYIFFLSIVMQRYALINLVHQLKDLGGSIKVCVKRESPKELFIRVMRYLFHPWNSLKKYGVQCVNTMEHVHWWWKGHRRKRPLDVLREQIKSVSLIRIENYFTQVSAFTLYNDFFLMCCNSFGIIQLYGEIEQKMSILNSYLTQQSDEKHEQAELKLSIILAILTVTSATNDIVQLAKVGESIKQPWLFIIGFTFAVTIFIFIFRTILKNMRN